MSKPVKLLPTGIVLGIIVTAIATSLWWFVQYHPSSLEKRMHFAKRDIVKLRSKEQSCYSTFDCKMIVLPTQECIPIDWIVSFSKRTDDEEAIMELVELYKELYRRRYGRDENLKCKRYNNPTNRCLEGRCVVRVYQGQILTFDE